MPALSSLVINRVHLGSPWRREAAVRHGTVFGSCGECSQSGHYFRASFCQLGKGTMRLLGLGFLIVWRLASAPSAITVADTVQPPPKTQTLPQPVPDVEEPIDLLNLLD